MSRNAVQDPEPDLKSIPTVSEEYINVSSMDAKKFILNLHTLKPIKERTPVRIHLILIINSANTFQYFELTIIATNTPISRTNWFLIFFNTFSYSVLPLSSRAIRD